MVLVNCIYSHKNKILKFEVKKIKAIMQHCKIAKSQSNDLKVKNKLLLVKWKTVILTRCFIAPQSGVWLDIIV